MEINENEISKTGFFTVTDVSGQGYKNASGDPGILRPQQHEAAGGRL
jgi:hypothetical protein